jgi:hypothetical protein
MASWQLHMHLEPLFTSLLLPACACRNGKAA